MANMFSFSFALISVIVFCANSERVAFRLFPSDTFEKTALFGRFQEAVEDTNRLLQPVIDSFSNDVVPEVDQDRFTSISCYRVRANIKNAYLPDNTKYFVCRDEYRYEIFTCPNGGIFNETARACIDLCEQKKPCLNQGQCIILPDLKLECVCRRDWTGERCEIPKSACVNDPCGEGNECRKLNALDYSQDYVCICGKQQTYGKSCDRSVPNPCLTSKTQFHPFAFSRHAYINCDKKTIFFQPCNSNLYWDQENKRCDRSLPDLLRSPFISLITTNDDKHYDHIKSAQWQNNVVMEKSQPITTDRSGQWQQNNQVSNMRTPSNQRFVSQTESLQDSNQQLLNNQYMETATVPPKIFHLQGFSSRNSKGQQPQWSNSGNDQFQASSDFQTQYTAQPQSWQVSNQQQQTRTGQMPSSNFETENGNAAASQGVTQSLFGWKSNPQGSSNKMNEKSTFDSMPTVQLKSWKQ
ncbi:unnamed protein product [Adineta steineri]|uniref:Uncharacterized protein n=1 Tax=Adineta steineri TaxID=433720 RepID=A0A814WX06_9BILA|nr:unnamed protein product [Adineta steineri]CAF1408853.1 unnamed protein product [Adineta steineri]